MGELDGQVAVVTGAGSGIGRATAIRLSADGASVVAADIDVDTARATVEEIAASGQAARAHAVDITDDESIERLRRSVLETEGHCDVLVNNAGWEQIQPFVDTDREFWQRIVSINLLGPIAITHAFVRDMISHGSGKIVNVASDAGRVGSSGETVYAGAKGGVIALTKSLARETARYAIPVNCVCPGPTDTPAFARVPERLQQALIRAIPFHRTARPEDIAHAVAFFASPRSSYITGQVLSVNGGLTMCD